MQLFLLTPFVVLALWKWPRKSIIAVVCVMVVSTILRYTFTFYYELTPMVYFGMPNSKFSETSDMSYTLPDHRATVYLTGVLLGFFLKKGSIKLNMTPAQVRYMWILCATLAVITVFGPCRIAYMDYVYSRYDAALYSAFAPITFGIIVCWAILTTNFGYAGWFVGILNWRGFRMFSNISYGVYLTQFPVFFYNIGRLRNPGFYNPFGIIDIPEIMTVILASAVLALIIELPFLEIRKIYFDSRPVAAKKCEDELIEKTSDSSLSDDTSISEQLVLQRETAMSG